MTTIFVAKLDFGVTEEELFSLFGQFGTVAKVNIAKDKDTGKPRGFAFVEMPNESEAQDAIRAIDNHDFNGRKCVVKQAEDRSGSKPPSRDGGGFKPRTDRPDNRPQRTDFNDRPKFQSEVPPIRPSSDDDDSVAPLPLKQIPKKKLTPTKKVEIDTTNDGKSKKPKMNAYKKSGKDNQFFDDDDDLDEEIDLFGFSEDDEELDDDYSKYVVNSGDDEDEEYDDDDYEDDEDYEDEDED